MDAAKASFDAGRAGVISSVTGELTKVGTFKASPAKGDAVTVYVEPKSPNTGPGFELVGERQLCRRLPPSWIDLGGVDTFQPR